MRIFQAGKKVRNVKSQASLPASPPAACGTYCRGSAARVHKEEPAGLGFSGAAMKISIPSRASSLLQPGGVRVVGEGQRQSNQALATQQ